MADKEKLFVKGMIFKAPRGNAPDYIKGSLSIKVEELVPFLQEHEKNGWVNVDLKESRGGKYYAELDTWEPKRRDEPAADEPAEASTEEGGIPF